MAHTDSTLTLWADSRAKAAELVVYGMLVDFHDAWILDDEFEDAFDMENMYQMKESLRMKFKRSSIITIL